VLFGKKEKKIVETINHYKETFTSEVGKKVLIDLIKSTNVMGTSFDIDPNQTAFNEGQKAVVLRILRTIETDPAQLIELINKAGQSEDSWEL